MDHRAKRKSKLAATFAFGLTSIMCMFVIMARSVILPTVMSELNGMDYYGITVILSSLSMSMTMPIAGKLGDIFGRKRIYCIGAVCYAASLLLCGVSENPIVFMIGIALTGIFYGFLYSQQMALMVDIYEPGERPRYIGYFTVINSLACLLGPVVGGAFTDTIGWRWVFYAVIPVALLNFLCGLEIKTEQSKAESAALDYGGTVLFIASTLPFLYALTIGGKSYSWISAPVLFLIGFSVLMVFTMIRYEKRVENPILPLPLFRNSAFNVALAVTVAGGCVYAMQNYLPIYYQSVKGVSVTVSGLITIPRQAGQMIISFLTGVYLSRQLKVRYRITYLATVACLTLSMLFMGWFGAATPIIVIFLCELLYGAPLGSQSVMSQALGTVSLDTKMMGSGLAFIGFASTFGNSLGSAVAGCIINQYWNLEKIVPQNLKEALGEANMAVLNNTSILQDKAKLIGIRNTLPAGLGSLFDSTVENLKAAINHGMSVAFFAFFVMLLAALVLVALVKWEKNIREIR